MCACGSGVERRKLARIFYTDGRSDLAKKIDGFIVETRDGFVRFIDRKTRVEMIIPLSRVYRIIFFEEGKDDAGRVVH